MAPGTISSGVLAPFVQELDNISPSFRIKGSQIKILRTPPEFYGTLKTKIKGAKTRIFLSTLYIGKTETELITVIQDALRGNKDVKLSILTDCLRGTREAPNPSCASLLAPLIEEFGPERVDIRMYHTPNLKGLRKKHVPKRINEGWGLQHMKLYGVDDEIILSGANLSSDYFTNRQDRYHLFSSPEITDYFNKIHNAVCSFSYQLRPSEKDAGFELAWPRSNAVSTPLIHSKTKHENTAGRIMRDLLLPSSQASEPEIDDDKDTIVYPISQMTQLMGSRNDLSTELPAITRVLELLSADRYQDSRWTFTAGYFNPARSLTKLLLKTKSKQNTVITASPYANGFYKSPGVSGMLPDAYTYLARAFLKSVREHNMSEAIVLKEWRKGTVGEPGAWTYHAKGLWIALPGDKSPCLSIIGSSNYTKRSYSLDLETGAFIVTRDPDLKKRLGEEEQWLQDHVKQITVDDLATNERRSPLGKIWDQSTDSSSSVLAGEEDSDSWFAREASFHYPEPRSCGLETEPSIFALLALLSPVGSTIYYAGVSESSGEFGAYGDPGTGLPGTFGVENAFIDNTGIDVMVNEHNVNLFRVVSLLEKMCLLATGLGATFDEELYGHLKDAVDYISATKGAYCILDLHNYMRYNYPREQPFSRSIIGDTSDWAAATTEQFGEFWYEPADRFKDNEKVIFGLMNELHDVASSRLLDNLQLVVDKLRETRATNLIIAPGYCWSGAHSWTEGGSEASSEWLNKLVDLTGNLAMDVHEYPDLDFSGGHAACESDQVANLEHLTEWLRANELTEFITEFGGSNTTGCVDMLNTMLDYMADNEEYIGAAGPFWGTYSPYYTDQNQWGSLEPGSTAIDGSPSLYNTIWKTVIAPKVPDELQVELACSGRWR
ncbi:CDP-diacylglycerol-glycerol-3-phosphate 3-phosphatidyltransferase [Zalerion maritima]|uniref:CDP-diacylglycerol--glycerol-3-phosphate 1-phosphatidyltransferase n=1 Tax=Zalerion maritima TaxID=339359 RepID=A0AAD5RR66_9PEZI|nr:CDP-diacylglycerol-glycerol-3-phosphate 3-phosphatidyltransferase [Zalerion maritima]